MSTIDIQQQFDTAYWASLPTPVQALSSQSLTPAQRSTLVESLIAQGFSTYMQNGIDSWGWDPFDEFTQAYQDGYTVGIPSILQLPMGSAGQYAPPGQTIPGQLGPYPTTLPPKWIAVPPMPQLNDPGANVAALLASWYPPFTPPPPTPPAPTDPVGPLAVGNTYLNVAGINESLWPNGSTYTDSRGTFKHVVVQTPFGAESYWQLLTASA